MSVYRRQSSSIAVGALLLVASLAIGCSSSKSSGRAKESEKAVEGFQNTRTSVIRAKAYVDRTNAALDQIASGSGDLQQSFKNYNTCVSDLEKSAAEAKKRAQTMRENLRAYTTKWQSEIDSMEDPTVRAGLQQRRDTVRANFDKVRTKAQAARDAYLPYIAQLKEIQRALSVDLTPQNVNALKPAMAKAKAQGETLKQALVEMQAELDSMTSGMSPSTQPAAAAATTQPKPKP